MKELYFTIKVVRLKLSKFYAAVSPKTRQLLIPAHILESLQKLRLFRKWHKAMVINPEDENSYTVQYQEPFL
jgi:hypothetical protein